MFKQDPPELPEPRAWRRWWNQGWEWSQRTWEAEQTLRRLKIFVVLLVGVSIGFWAAVWMEGQLFEYRCFIWIDNYLRK